MLREGARQAPWQHRLLAWIPFVVALDSAVMLALVASIHVLNHGPRPSEDVDGRDKPDHDEVCATQARQNGRY